MIAYTLAGIVLVYAALLAYWTIRRVAILQAALSEIQAQLAAKWEIEEHRQSEEEGQVPKLTAQLARMEQETLVRLADMELDNGKRYGEIRELVRGYVENGRSQADRRLQEIVMAVNDCISGADMRSEAAAQVAEGLHQSVAAINARVSEIASSLADLPVRISARIEPLLVRPTVRGFPIDPRFLHMSEAEMLAAAESLSFLRPLAPYPGWRFDAEWSNSDLTFQLRQWLWQQFHDQRSERPIVANWHGGTRLHLYLGNDLSRQIYIGGCIDPNEFVFLDRYLRPGMTFLDAGANEGIYSIFAAGRVGGDGLVWAFEPSRREVERLQSNLALNGLQATVFPVALAESEGSAPFRIAGYEHEGQNTLGSFIYEGIETAATETVQLMPLDEIVKRNPPPRVDILKVDVEGAELRVFRGAIATIERYRPVILFEVSDEALRRQDSNQEELLGFLATQGYDLFSFDPQSGLPMPASGAFHSDNMIAVPQGMQLPDVVYRPWPNTR